MAGRQDIFQQAMNQGHSAAWDQLWDQAASYYRQALEEFPENPQALSSLGLALIELQSYDEALKAYQKAARFMPEDPVALEKIAQLTERMGQLDIAVQASLRAAEQYLKNRDAGKAVENWERVTRLNPENLTAHARLALVLERLGDKARAVSEYIAVASLYQSAGDPDKAQAGVNQALRVLPTSEEALNAQALLKDFKPLPKPSRPKGGTAPLRMQQVRKLELLEAPEKAPELDPVAMARQKALTLLAGMLFEGSDEERDNRRGLSQIVTGATGMLQRPVDRTKMILHLSQMIDLQSQNNAVRATEELQKAIEAGLENAAAYFDLGYLYAQSGRLESAIRQLQSSVKHHDFGLASRLLLGDLLQKKGQLREASFEYLEALKLADAMMVAPKHANDLLQLYDLLIESNRRINEEIQARMCTNIRDMLMRPDWKTQLRKAREQLPASGDNTPIPLAEILLEARSGRVIAAMSSIYDLVQDGSYRTAMEEAFYILQESPTYLPLHATMGEMLVKQNDVNAAVAKFQVISRVYESRGDASQAINFLRRVVELSPADLAARGRLIDLLARYGKIDAAIHEYEQLAAFYFSLGDFPMARKTYTEALRAAQQANVDRAIRVKIMHRMADIDMQSLDWRQALRVLEQIRTLQPEDTEARSQIIRLNLRMAQEQPALAELDNYIAFMNSSHKLGDLVAFMESVAADHPQNIPVLRRLADVYRGVGRVPDAINQLDAIGDMLLEAGDRAGAIQTIEMILMMDPPNRQDYLQVLEQLRAG